jgi:FkbM family methyltransferase
MIMNNVEQINYTFIDIGCGHTNVSVDQYGLNVHGLLVEPIREFCNVLPSSDTVLVECSAIVEYDGAIEMHVSSRDMSGIHYIPITALNTPAHLERMLKNHKIFGAESIAVKRDILDSMRVVACMRLETLLNKYRIKTVEQLKIDVEGCENIVLQQLIELMRMNKFAVSESIIFEYNDLSDKKELDGLSEIICNEFGFTSSFRKIGLNEDIVMTKIK